MSLTFYRVTVTLPMTQEAWIEARSEAEAKSRALSAFRAATPHVWSSPTPSTDHIVSITDFHISANEVL